MRGLAAGLTGVCGAVVTAVFLALAAGRVTTRIAAGALVFGAVLAAVSAWFCDRPALQKVRGVGTWIAIVVFVLFTLRAFLWVVFQTGDEIRVLSPNNLGDLSLHLTYINQLAGGGDFWLDNPIFPGVPLHYPIGVDLLNALLVRCGANVYRSLIWVGLAGCAATGLALYRWGRGFAVAGFLFNGGFAAIEFFWTGELRDFQADLAWKSFPLAMLVTQRGLLYALPAGLLLLASWRARFFGNAGSWRLPLWMDLLLYATMPLFHFHTFVFLSMLLGCWVITTRGQTRKNVLTLLGLAILPGAWCTVLVTGLFKQGTLNQTRLSDLAATHPEGWLEKIELTANLWLAQHHVPLWLKAGWMQRGENFVSFWLTNFGLFPVLIAALCFLAIRQRNRHPVALHFVFPAVGFFLLCCVVMFAPWEWDNTKLMIWCVLAVLPFAWEIVLVPMPLPARIVACIVLFFSGFLSLLGGLDASHRGEDIAQRSELDGLHTPLAALSFNEIHAGEPTWNHPLLLTGRKMALGYAGHLWSHGIDYKARNEQFRRFMNGDADWREIAAELNLRYVFWGERERTAFPESTQPWRAEEAVMLRGKWGEVFELREAERGWRIEDGR